MRGAPSHTGAPPLGSKPMDIELKMVGALMLLVAVNVIIGWGG